MKRDSSISVVQSILQQINNFGCLKEKEELKLHWLNIESMVKS